MAAAASPRAGRDSHDSPAMIRARDYFAPVGTMTGRRFPPPWRADRIPGGYVVRDANGQALVYLYSRDSEAEAMQAKVLTQDEARRIAVKRRTAARAAGQAGRRRLSP
jgi:hypothetical protein